MGRPSRVRAFATSRWVLVAMIGALVGASCFSTASAALPTTPSPVLTLTRTIRTTPYIGTSSSMRDGEGSAFVPNNSAHPNIGGTDSMWIAEDNGRAVWEIDPTTGALKSSIHDATWQATRQYNSSSDSGTGATAGANRDPDIESMAYDAQSDTIYTFSGKCCTSSVLPTAYRLRRGSDHTFHPDSYQPLPSGSDYTAAAWHPGDHRVYVGVSSDVRTYDYATNSPGSAFNVSGVSGIFGMSFSDDGNDLLVVNSSVKLLRANWNTKSLVPGWSIDLKPFGMKDSRAVELINNQLFVLDGYDGRSSGDPLRYAVFVFDVCCSTGVPSAPGTPTAAAGVGSATVNFSAPTSHGSSPITGYTVTSSPGGATCSTSGALTCTVTGLSSNTSYQFRAVARNSSGSGDASPPSNAVVVLAGRYTVLVSAPDLASINTAADYFAIPRSDALITGARLMRYFDFLTQPAGLGPLTPPVPSTGPSSLVAAYTDASEVTAMQQLASRTGITVENLHDIGVHLLVYLWFLSTK